MRVTYRARFRDVVYLSWYHTTRSPVLVVLLLLVSAYWTWRVCGPSVREFGIPVFVVTCVLMMSVLSSGIFLLSFAISILALLSRKNRTILTEITLELYENNFVGQNRYSRTEYAWDVVQKLRRTRKYILAYVSHGSAILIPKRAFTSEEDWDSFYEFFRSHCDSEATR